MNLILVSGAMFVGYILTLVAVNRRAGRAYEPVGSWETL